MLETMVTSEPGNVLENLNKNTNMNVNSLNVVNESMNEETHELEFQPETLEKRNEVNNTLMPPNTTEDRMMNVNTNTNTLMEEKQRGGSLLNTLMKLAQVTAPAALLTGAAAYRTKRKSRKSKKSKKRMTRRR